MAAYDTLRAAIDNYIKANGNKEITGTVLNDILNAMVSALGADTRFAGVAVPSTNPGNPEGNVVYFASQAGTYSNFGGIVLPLGIHILVWNGTAWTSQTWFSVDNTPTQNSQNLALSGGILQAIVDAVGVERLRAIGVEVTSCSFDSTTKKISFFNSANSTLFQLDATAFVIDGMVSDVKIEDGNLVIQFNTDAGKQDIEIPLADIFNPANYYTKTAIDALLALYYTKTETDALLTAINNKLADGCLYRGMAEPTTNPPTPTTKVFYIATKAGTYTNFDNIAVTEGITILKHDGSNWGKEQICYSDGVFDISAYNGTSYADLSAALGTNGANIPENLRKGGMSVKFVQSSDNKYVQFRCMAHNFTTDVTQWQGVDDEPTAGSENLVKSGGVASAVGINNITLNKGNIHAVSGAIGTGFPMFVYSDIITGPFEINVNNDYWVYDIWEFANKSATTGSRRVMGPDSTNKPKSKIVNSTGLYRVCITKVDDSYFTFDENDVCTENVINNISNGLKFSKQDRLVSGTNIKTINGEDIIGSGNINTHLGYKEISQQLLRNGNYQLSFTVGKVILKNGTVQDYSAGKYTEDFYKIEPGVYYIDFDISGNAATVVLYDKDQNPCGYIERGNANITIPSNAMFVRFSSMNQSGAGNTISLSDSNRELSERIDDIENDNSSVQGVALYPNAQLPCISFRFDDAADNDDLVVELFDSLKARCDFAFIARNDIISVKGEKYLGWNKRGYGIISHSIDASKLGNNELSITAVSISNGNGTITTTGAYINNEFTELVGGQLTKIEGSGDSSIEYSAIAHGTGQEYTFTVSGVSNVPSVGDKYNFIYTREYLLKMLSTAKNRLEALGMSIHGFSSPESSYEISRIDLMQKVYSYAYTFKENVNFIYSRNSNPCMQYTESIETPSLAATKARIDDAIAKDQNLALYGHTANFGTTYNGEEWNIAKLQEIVEYVIAKRDAGLVYFDIADKCNEYYYGSTPYNMNIVGNAGTIIPKQHFSYYLKDLTQGNIAYKGVNFDIIIETAADFSELTFENGYKFNETPLIGPSETWHLKFTRGCCMATKMS